MLYQCNNCGWETTNPDEINPEIPDLYERIESGDIYPEGTCPKCGCFVHNINHVSKIACLTLIIETCDGDVVNVQNLPDGWDYEVHDYADDPDDTLSSTGGNDTILESLQYLVEYLRFHTAESADWDALLPEHNSILERCEATIQKATTGLPE